MSISKADVARLLTMMAAIDKRTVGDSDIAGWQAVLDDTISFDRYAEAIKRYYQQHTKHLMPAELIQVAKTVPRGEPTAFYGQPGEVQCSKCHGVHFPAEPCSVLIKMPKYGIERFVREFNAARVAKGNKPWPEDKIRKWCAARGVAVPESEEIPF